MVPKTQTDAKPQSATKPQNGARPIHALLRENETLLPFHQRLRQLSKLQKTFVDALPPGLIDSSRIATLEGSTMVIATANGAIAAKLKQMLPRLLESFGEKYCQNKKQYQEVTAISVIVQPEFFVAESQRRVSLPRQPMPYQKLLELAESLEDSPLKTALDSIASKNKRTLTNKENKR